MECVKESFKYGEMSSSQRKAVINLIEKQGKYRTPIENWRLISLIIHMKKLHDSDWLRAVQFKCNTCLLYTSDAADE